MKTILLDCDGIVANFHTKVCDYLKDKYSKSHPDFEFHNIKLEHITGDFRKMKFVGSKRNDSGIYCDIFLHWDESDEDFCKSEGFCYNIPLFDGAKEFIQEIENIGKVLFVTSPYKNSRTWVHERTCWLEDNFGYDRHSIIFAKEKKHVSGHVLVDDLLSNVIEWSEHNRKDAILLKRPWNKQSLQDFAKNNDVIFSKNKVMCFGHKKDYFCSFYVADTYSEVLSIIKDSIE